MPEYMVWSSSLNGAHIACASSPELAMTRAISRYGNPTGDVVSCLATDPPYASHEDCPEDACKRPKWIGKRTAVYFTAKRQINRAVLRGDDIYHE